ncbi:carbohydrate porin [Gluconacetobacter entanii]|uniref:Carbohydrate porin n=2 Tax=Gluconacetobacter entanii TaxID=108528 RepID=A0ABT3K758_9PROT|nr:carbohydrate porin [Gluconacetobacter entanii]MCW4591257.1 carbohydrate porin [Gluconacetobacter entanii]MCW4595499.1 carbohydrate porin [Gluconacetobacter entanii]NPC88581.1 carbohydrate porin [Gluconacetobacter entanii]
MVMKNMPHDFRTASSSPRALPAFMCSVMTAAALVLPHCAHAQPVADTTTSHAPAPSSPSAPVPAHRENAEEYGPTPRSIQRPPNTPIPPSGVPLIPTAGLAPLSVAPISSPGDKTSFHKIELDALSHHEGIAGLLPASVDAMRDTDLEDPYYVPTAGTGHLVPQLGGFRSMLLNHGVSFAFTYKGEAMGVIDGGVQRGMSYVHELTAQVNFDLEKMANLTGWSVHTLVMERAGRAVSRDRVGEYYVNLQEVYGLSGHMVAHLVDFYAEKKLLNNHLDITFGRMALTHVFATSPLLCSFMVTCSAPVALKLDPGFSVYPKATWGARLRLRPTRDTAIQLGAYEVSPLASNPSGWAWDSEPATGLMLPIEFTWQPFLTRNRLPGHYVLGYAHDTTRYPDQIGVSLPAALRTAAGRQRSAPMDMFWFEGDQMIYRRGGRNQMAGGYLMAGYIHNTPHVTSIADQAYGGLSFAAVIPSRMTDRLGIMYSWYHVSHRKEEGQVLIQDAGYSLGSAVRAPQTSSHIIEAYYAIDAAPGVLVQPEFEYMIHPGETHHIPNAALVGLKVIANL